MDLFPKEDQYKYTEDFKAKLQIILEIAGKQNKEDSRAQDLAQQPDSGCTNTELDVFAWPDAGRWASVWALILRHTLSTPFLL